jgi:hypothetical protein
MKDNLEPIKDYHVAFARAVIALAREHGVGHVNLKFRRASSRIYNRDIDAWDATEIQVAWHEGRHGSKDNIRIEFRAEANATFPEIDENDPLHQPTGAAADVAAPERNA